MKPLPGIAWALGYGGLIPFLLLSGALLLGKPLPYLAGARLDWWLASYTSIILSFIGAVHWGVVLGMEDLMPKDARNLLIYSVLPGLVAWFVLLLPIKTALFVLALLVLLAYGVDAQLLFRKLNSRYAILRLHLTLVVTLLLFAVATLAP